MTMRLNGIDREIQQLEQRIADDRAAFVAAITDCGHSVRETVSSPKSLLAVAGIGFVAGKLLFRPAPKYEKPAHAPKTGVLGLLAAGLSLMQPGFGAGGIARWAAKELWERRKTKRGSPAEAATATAPRGSAASATPPVRMPLHTSPLETPTITTR